MRRGVRQLRDQVTGRGRWRAALAPVVIALLWGSVILTGCGGDGSVPAQAGTATALARSASAPTGTATATTDTTATPPGSQPTPSARPNIVFVLTDDLSMNLLRFMPHVQAMQRDGMTFRDYFVTDSLCCPSRSSIFTGQFPHDTHVFSNSGSDGGLAAFRAHGGETRTFALALHAAGYRTGMMGKYLNGYVAQQPRSDRSGPTGNDVPPGWDEWDLVGWGYPEFNYHLNHNGEAEFFGGQPRDYLTDVIARRGVAFVHSSAALHRPFFLELATFAPHGPYVPAPRDANQFPGLDAPRPESFDRLPTHAPRWLAHHLPLSARGIAQIDQVFQRRAQSVLAVDEMIGAIEQELRAVHAEGNTYLVFSSDNGLHTGEYRLDPGKMTAFDTDIHVPLLIVGPGVASGAVSPAVAENVDLAGTFAQIAGTSMRGDGHSLLALLHGGSPSSWRTAALIEHRRPDPVGTDPDFQPFGAGNPRSYEALRTAGYLYVEYNDGEREYYDLRADPLELHNVAGRLPPDTAEGLHRALARMVACHGEAACWQAGHVPAVWSAPPAGVSATGRAQARPS